jgi:putative intracellular protease/amidase
MKQALIPLPDRDFNTTEVSLPWKHFAEAGLQVIFSTETGQMGQTNPRLLKGVMYGQFGAKPEAIAAYRELEKTKAFQHPVPYENIDPQAYDILLLTGGHATGMRQYLESKIVQNKTLEFLKQKK